MINLILEFLFIRARVMNFPYAQFLMSLILLLFVVIYIYIYALILGVELGVSGLKYACVLISDLIC